MKTKSLIGLVLLALYSMNGERIAFGQAANTSPAPTTSAVDPIKLKITTPWHDTTVKLIVSGTSGSAAIKSKILEIPAKTAIYQGAVSDTVKMRDDFSVVAFFDPSAKQACVVQRNYSGEGKDGNQVFYISDGSGVTICSIGHGSLWLDESYTEMAAANADLDKAIARFEAEFDQKILTDGMFRSQPISLRPANDPWFFEGFKK